MCDETECPMCGRVIGRGVFECDETDGAGCKSLQLLSALDTVSEQAEQIATLKAGRDRLRWIVENYPIEYVPQDVAADCLALLNAAGQSVIDEIGGENTLQDGTNVEECVRGLMNSSPTVETGPDAIAAAWEDGRRKGLEEAAAKAHSWTHDGNGLVIEALDDLSHQLLRMATPTDETAAAREAGMAWAAHKLAMNQAEMLSDQFPGGEPSSFVVGYGTAITDLRAMASPTDETAPEGEKGGVPDHWAGRCSHGIATS